MCPNPVGSEHLRTDTRLPRVTASSRQSAGYPAVRSLQSFPYASTFAVYL